MTIKSNKEGQKIFYNKKFDEWEYTDKGFRARLGLLLWRFNESKQINTRNPYPYLKHIFHFFILGNPFSYCRMCGVRVYDYMVSDKIWRDVTGWKNGEGILCYQCFCKLSDKKGISYRL